MYELLLGTLGQASISPDSQALRFVGRILDIVFLDFEEFFKTQSSQRFESVVVPNLSTGDDLQLWLITQLLRITYPGSLSEISESSHTSETGRVLASSAVRPWEPSLWDPPKSFEMLSGYASRTGVPLVVQKVEQPWKSVIESIEPELRFLRSSPYSGDREYSAMAIPIALSSGVSVGALYLVLPRVESEQLGVEVRVAELFGRIAGEVIERQRAAIYTATVSSDISTLAVLKGKEFTEALLEMLRRRADEITNMPKRFAEVRLPFLLLSAQRHELDPYDVATSDRLKEWLVQTLEHLEWRSFLRSHWREVNGAQDGRGFMGELPGVGMIIALDRLVTKDELDQIRSAFPSEINRTMPSNAPVKLVAWVLDVPARHIQEASETQSLQDLASDINGWALDVASVIDDVSQGAVLSHERGEWDAALRRVRRALRTEGGAKNGYLYRIAAECSFALGDWPGALRYSQEGAKISKRELGSGFVRSMCQAGDAHLCLCDPIGAWDLYTEAVAESSTHPLPVYYRGQAMMLVARLAYEFQIELLRAGPSRESVETIDVGIRVLVNRGMDDLTTAADLLEKWGLIPEAYQYRNFHLVPTLLAQGFGYMLTGEYGPAASRLQSARRSFPKDDLFFREFLFAKCLEQGLHRRYGELLLGESWIAMRRRLEGTLGGS